MATYTSKDNLKYGVPLGGIGAGTLQIFPDGTRGNFTGKNNWSKPLGQIHNFRGGIFGDYRAAYPFAIYVDYKDKKIAKLLQTLPINSIPVVRHINYEGIFPVVTLGYDDNDLNKIIKLTLTAYSPFILGDHKNSSIPGAIYKFSIKNLTKSKLTVSIMACGVNVNGDWNIGRFNKIRKSRNLLGIDFKHDRPSAADAGVGTLCLATENGPTVYYCNQAQWISKGFFELKKEDIDLKFWENFKENGELSNVDGMSPVEGEMGEIVGAICKKIGLLPRQEKHINFYYAWHMPNYFVGHRYEKWFSNSWDVAHYLSKNNNLLYRKTKEWQDIIINSGIDDWMKDGLINSLYVYTASSWYTRDGKFAEIEFPFHHPLMGTLDVRYYGSLPLAMFFPYLERSVMDMFAVNQRKNGYIPHDLGRFRLDCPSNGTSSGPYWKDLATKYILLCYRNYLVTKDLKHLKKIYPVLKKAMLWQMGTDKDGDCLSESEGIDSTFDNLHSYGANSYVCSIHLAALLAMARICNLIGDNYLEQECMEWFERGKKNFNDKLWNGKYYIAVYNSKDCAEDCTLGQLNGQWFAHLLNLGYIQPSENVKKAVRTILDMNCSVSKYGAINSVGKDGSIIKIWNESNSQAANIWPGETYAFASLCIYEGFVNEGLKLAKKTYSNFLKNNKHLWCQGDTINRENGDIWFGEYCLRNLSFWTILPALAKYRKNYRTLWNELMKMCYNKFIEQKKGGRYA